MHLRADTLHVTLLDDTGASVDAQRRTTSAQLDDTYENIRSWSDSVARFDAEAEQARRIASELDAETDPLRRLFDSVWALQTPATWEGRAADHSRQRLARHEDDVMAGLRRIDRLIDELHARAAVAQRAADTSRDALESAQRRAVQLEADLRHLHDQVG